MERLQATGHAARLDVRALAQRAGGRTILEAVTLSVLPGECVGLLGPSGSGKSTLLKACCGLTRPASGEVLLDGQSLYQHRDAWRSRIGYVPQEDILHRELTVKKALGYAARLRLGADADVEAAVERVLAAVGLVERANVRVGALSGGQRKRASVGLELLMRPAILYLDEPTSGQDPHLEARMMDLFRQLAAAGTTVVVTTHAMANVDMLDHVAMLHGGRLVFFGPPTALLAHFQTPSFEGVFKRLASGTPHDWAVRYRESDLYRQLVLGRTRGAIA